MVHLIHSKDNNNNTPEEICILCVMWQLPERQAKSLLGATTAS